MINIDEVIKNPCPTCRENTLTYYETAIYCTNCKFEISRKRINRLVEMQKEKELSYGLMEYAK